MLTTDQNQLLHYVSQTKQHDRALLLVTFGSTYEGPHQTFARLKATFAESFPDRDIYMAFTSKFCIRKWKEKTGEEYFTTDKWLEALGEAGYSSISIQSLHVIPGLEYSFIEDRYLPLFHKQFPTIPTTVGVPLLWSKTDIQRVGNAIYSLFRDRIERGEALILMGHGNHTDKYPEANDRYRQLDDYLQTLSPRILVGTVDYESMLFDHVAERLAEVAPAGTVLNLLPLMSVAGDHALNDLAGDEEEGEPLEEQSWKVRFKAQGYRIDPEHCHMKGLADFASLRQIWVDHLMEAESKR